MAPTSRAVIDLHCHILPALDDGALDLADAVAMAREAEADGIDVICATPHIRHDHDVLVHEIASRVQRLNAELDRQGVAVRVLVGGELAETAIEGLDETERRQVSLGGAGRWILLEPAPGPVGDSLLHAVRRLAAAGHRSVIAHPERHAGADLAERLAALTSEGALIQMTADLLTDERAGPALLDLAERGLLHLLGSDSHSSRGGRPARLSQGLAALARSPTVRPHLEWISRTAPEAIVRGSDLDPPLSVRV